MSQHLFHRITIIGLGLIGSSIARAVHEKNIAGTIVGYDRNEISLAYGRKHGFINIATSDIQDSVKDSDLIIIATPPSTLENIAKAIAPALKTGCIVMDVCSVKEAAIAAIAPQLPAGVHFIPAHPIAGSEHSGIAAGRPDLFERKRVVITPEESQLQTPVILRASDFWKVMGARVEAMPAHLHDMIYAYVSHLPQLLTFAVGNIIKSDSKPETELLQKFRRLSHSNTEMWAEIFLLNKDNIIRALNRYLDAITHITKELSEAPEGTINKMDKNLASTALFPRIVASCLITTVMEAEKKSGFPFARFAGSGFADFTYPASQPPEGDIESIANQYQAVQAILNVYIDRLKAMGIAIDAENIDLLSAKALY